MAQAFASVSPAIFAEVRDALLTEGRVELAEQLAKVRVDRCTFGEDGDVGYVYFVRRPPSLHFAALAAPVAETISFENDQGFYLDVDHDGDLFGLEFLSRPDWAACLKTANEL